MVITVSYLLMIWSVDRFLEWGSHLTRFLILGSSVFVFLVLRDRIQRLIDRLFHREAYDSASVVSDFERKLLGVYRFDDMKQKIVEGLDEIFHFKTFAFILKKSNLVYELAFVHGIDPGKISHEFEIAGDFEDKLLKSKVFSPAELNGKPPLLDILNGELIIPMVSEGLACGFFICGPKRSGRDYSIQDIQVLSLLAQRVIALLQTANLFRKDLDRQLMLEKERARISQDMHDDVGSSLTRISILSELARNSPEIKGVTRQWLEQIGNTSREVTEEMSQIIWALNPKNDTMEGLIAYIRRFASEYTEPTSLHLEFDLPGVLPISAKSAEIRRNIYLVVREALHNVVKHSGAKKVCISATAKEPWFYITISDDGNGFDPQDLKFPGNGLTNMKKRMEEIGGELLVKSNPGIGTEITLVIASLPEITTIV
jgi:signal transduction histidine kinase